MTKSLLQYYFPRYSESHIEKTLKKLFDKKILLRRTIDYEPIGRKREYVYYLSRKGANKVFFVSDLFGGVEEINIASGNPKFMFHDLCVSWVATMWEKQGEEYEDIYFNKIAIEARRSFLKINHVIPDLRITTEKDKTKKTYYVEIDNFSVQKKEWQQRSHLYREILNRSSYFLIVTTKYNEKRVNLLLETIERNIQSNVFITSIEEFYHSSYLANIWRKKNSAATTQIML